VTLESLAAGRRERLAREAEEAKALAAIAPPARPELSDEERLSIRAAVERQMIARAEETAARYAATGNDYDRRERLRRLRSLPLPQRRALLAMSLEGMDLDRAAQLAGMAKDRWTRMLMYPTIRRFLAEMQREMAPARVALALGALTNAATDPLASPKERVQAAKELAKIGGGDRALTLHPVREASTANVQVNVGALPAGPGEVIRAAPGIVLDLRRESMDARHLVEDAVTIEPALDVRDARRGR
jgi:hypothetical protein